MTRRFDLHDQEGFLASEQRICVAFANRCVWFGLLVYWHSLRLDVLALFMMALDSGKGYPHGVRPIPSYFGIVIAKWGVQFGFLRCGCVYHGGVVAQDPILCAFLDIPKNPSPNPRCPSTGGSCSVSADFLEGWQQRRAKRSGRDTPWRAGSSEEHGGSPTHPGSLTSFRPRGSSTPPCP